MALFQETKDLIKAQIDELKFEKAPIVQKIKDLNDQRQTLIDQRDALDAKIQKLQTDLSNG